MKKNSDVFNLPLRVEYNGMYKETADNLVDSFNSPINLFGLEKGFLAEAIVRSVNEHDKLKAGIFHLKEMVFRAYIKLDWTVPFNVAKFMKERDDFFIECGNIPTERVENFLNKEEE